jgi:hypothetical protein
MVSIPDDKRSEFALGPGIRCTICQQDRFRKGVGALARQFKKSSRTQIAAPQAKYIRYINVIRMHWMLDFVRQRKMRRFFEIYLIAHSDGRGMLHTRSCKQPLVNRVLDSSKAIQLAV